MDKRHLPVDELALRLLPRIAQKDEKAFVELFLAINRRIFPFARHILRNDEDAEDVLVATALELWEHPERFRGEARFMTYALGIARHKAGDLLRSRGRREKEVPDAAEDLADDDGPSPFDIAWTGEKLAAIERCMSKLPERQRITVYLAYFEDMSREDIGGIIGCDANAVRQHLWQGLRKLAPCLAASGLD